MKRRAQVVVLLAIVVLTSGGLLYYSNVIDAPPTAEILAPMSGAEIDETTVLFEGRGESRWGRDLSFDWDFGDGRTGQGVSVEHRYARAGNYNVTLTVSDGRRETHAETKVTVGSRRVMLDIPNVLSDRDPLAVLHVFFIVDLMAQRHAGWGVALSEILRGASEWVRLSSQAPRPGFPRRQPDPASYAIGVFLERVLSVSLTEGRLTVNAPGLQLAEWRALQGHLQESALGIVEDISFLWSWKSDAPEQRLSTGQTGAEAWESAEDLQAQWVELFEKTGDFYNEYKEASPSEIIWVFPERRQELEARRRQLERDYMEEFRERRILLSSHYNWLRRLSLRAQEEGVLANADQDMH